MLRPILAFEGWQILCRPTAAENPGLPVPSWSMDQCEHNTTPRWKPLMQVPSGGCGLPLIEPRAATRHVWWVGMMISICFLLITLSVQGYNTPGCWWEDPGPESFDSTYLKSCFNCPLCVTLSFADVMLNLMLTVIYLITEAHNPNIGHLWLF